jgi:hypothetical protein
LGERRLDTIHNKDVQRLTLALRDKAPRTVNNVLMVLSVLLKKAIEWGELDRLPCAIKLVKVPKSAADFYDFAEYERSVAGARATDRRAELLALLGGEAGLRSGEMAQLLNQWVLYSSVPTVKVADVLHAQGQAAIGAPCYRALSHGRARHLDQCDACEYQAISYNSVSQSALSEVPGTGARALARRTRAGSPRRAVCARRLHAAACIWSSSAQIVANAAPRL